MATQSSTSTTRDNNVKAELEAAEAGLHIASYRLSQLKPSETQCITEKEAVEAKTTEEAEFANGSGKTLEASIYAPKAQVHIEGGVKFRGGVVGYEVWLEGGSENFEWNANTGKLTGAASSYSRQTWGQCPSGSGLPASC